MELIPDWKKAVKLFSVQANAIGAALASTYGLMYPQLRESIPPQWMAGITSAVFIAGIVCRVISQQPKETNDQA